MSPEDADLLLALEVLPIDGVYELARRPPGWPRLFVALRSDSGQALGEASARVVRALPHRDRSYIGIAATDRLRELWLPLGEPLVLPAHERAAAEARAAERERAYAIQAARIEAERPPVSVPVMTKFQPHRVWTLSDRTVVVLEVVPDPFRSPPAPLLVVTDDDRLFARIARRAPGPLTVERARTAKEAVAAIGARRPLRIVCSEACALGPGGLLQWAAREEAGLASRVEMVCDEGTAEWVEKLLETSSVRPTEILEEPLDDEAIDDLVGRARRDAG